MSLCWRAEVSESHQVRDTRRDRPFVARILLEFDVAVHVQHVRAAWDVVEPGYVRRYPVKIDENLALSFGARARVVYICNLKSVNTLTESENRIVIFCLDSVSEPGGPRASHKTINHGVGDFSIAPGVCCVSFDRCECIVASLECVRALLLGNPRADRPFLACVPYIRSQYCVPRIVAVLIEHPSEVEIARSQQTGTAFRIPLPIYFSPPMDSSCEVVRMYSDPLATAGVA